MIIKNVLYYITFFLIISCKTSVKEEQSKLLTDGNFKYWDVVELPGFYIKSQSRVYPMYSYYLDKNGRWKFYEYREGYRLLFNRGDIVIPERWEYKSDSILLLGNQITKIKKLTKDSLILVNKNKTTKLIKSRFQTRDLDTVINELHTIP